MAHEKVHVICENLCLEEGMTKQQINDEFAKKTAVEALASGSPKGTYTDSAALKAANPDTGVYIATSNGHIYAWTKDSTSNPVDLGVYQAAEDSDTVNELKAEVTRISGLTKLEFESGFISLTDSVIDINTVVSSTDYKHTVAACTSGEVFTISGAGGSGRARLYAFIKSDGTPIKVTGQNSTLNKALIYAPDEAAYLIINDNSDSDTYRGIFTDTSIEDLLIKYKGSDIAGWEIGTFDTSNGNNSVRTDRLRSTFLDSEMIEKLFINHKYKMQLFAYQKGVGYVGAWSGSTWVTSGLAQLERIDLREIANKYPNYKFRVVIVSSSNVAGTEGSEITVLLNKVLPKTVNLGMFTLGDGNFDETFAVQHALDLAENNILYIPDGTYKIKKTCYIHDNTSIYGNGENSLLKLGYGYSLDGVTWRNDYKYPIVTTDSNANNVIIKNVAIFGDTTAFNDIGQIGLLMRATNSLVENVYTSDINYFPNSFESRRTNAPGWGIGLIHCNNVKVLNCKCVNSGYEGIGMESSDNIVVDKCYVGDGNRTGIQIHRYCHNVIVSNNTVENTNTLKHADITIHAESDDPSDNLKIINNSLKVACETKASIQFVAGYEENVVIKGNNINSKTLCIWAFEYEKKASVVITDNIMKSETGGLKLYGRSYQEEGQTVKTGNFIVCNNIIDAVDRAILIYTINQYIIENNLYLDNDVIR